MPDYIWQFICQNALPDGEYKFPEGTLVIINGFAGWKPAQS